MERHEATGRDAHEGRESIVRLLERGCGATAEAMAAIPPQRLDAPSPCSEWTVRQVGDHLVETLGVFARLAEGEHVGFSEGESGGPDPDPDHLGSDPGAAFGAAAQRCVAALGRPGVLDREFPFPFGPTSGLVIANIGLSEVLVHGWDIAQGAGVPYEPDATVVEAVAAFQNQDGADDSGLEGMFDPALPVDPDTPVFTALLARLGRRVPQSPSTVP